jgi:hypothetical protein
LYGGVAVHRPPSPAAVLPVKFVGGRELRFQVNEFDPARVGEASASVPPGPKYQVRAVVPGIGKRSKDFSKPG